MPDMCERVSIGLALVDREYPADWIDRINLARLNMARWGDCIGGQLEGNYIQFAAKHSLGADDTLAHAFNPDMTIPADNDDLTEAWRAAIAHRRQVRYAIPAAKLAAV